MLEYPKSKSGVQADCINASPRGRRALWLEHQLLDTLARHEEVDGLVPNAATGTHVVKVVVLEAVEDHAPVSARRGARRQRPHFGLDVSEAENSAVYQTFLSKAFTL